MGYLQTTTGITATGPGATLSFTTPICPQITLQVSGVVYPATATVIVEGSLDGINFSQVTLGGGNGTQSDTQSFYPLAAFRYNVTSISHSPTMSISIAAAPSGSQ